jgi:hypothetical protein
MPKKKISNAANIQKPNEKSMDYNIWRLAQTDWSREDAFWELCTEDTKKKPHIAKIAEWFREFDFNSKKFMQNAEVKGQILKEAICIRV